MRSTGGRRNFSEFEGGDSRPGPIFWPAAFGAAALALLAVYGGIGRAPKPEIVAGVLTPAAPFAAFVRNVRGLDGG